jgi:hypothetical protein
MSDGRNRRWGLGVALLLVGAVGCSDSPEQCSQADLGYFSFTTSFGTTGDLFRTETGTLVKVEKLSAVDPPQVAYRIERLTGEMVDLLIPESGYRFPVQTDSVYTFQMEDYDYPGGLLRGYSVVIWDAQGMFVAAAVSDLDPQRIVLRGPSPKDDEFPPGPGYPIDDLEVFFTDQGCSPRVVDTPFVRDITNWALEFKLGAARITLFNGERGAFAGYEAEVIRAQKITAKTQSANVPRMSYYLESKAAAARPRAGA